DPPTYNELYTLSLHDALPICHICGSRPFQFQVPKTEQNFVRNAIGSPAFIKHQWAARRATGKFCTARPCPSQRRTSGAYYDPHRSEEHTSELQSRENLVCRLL